MLASVLLCTSLVSAQGQAAPSFDQGAQAFAAGEFEKAHTLLRKAAEQQPKSFEVRLLLGATLVELGRSDEAIEQLLTAHKLNPGHADVLKLLAAQYMGRRNYAQANALLKPAAAAAVADAEIFLLLVESLTSAGDTATSFEYAQKAVNRFPSSPQVLCWMGFQLQFSGRYEEARKYLEKAVRVAPDYPASYYLLADILLKEHRFRDAVPYFQKAVEADPNDVDARIGYGQSLASLGRLEEGLVQLQQAVRIAPLEARVHYQLSRLYFQMGDEARAEEEARLSAKLRPPAPLITDVPSALRTGPPPR